ncbi:hypothetical protein D1871_10930 [Nakamurella silvestris]|nr:hypothetical protein D1871_10930 [Nakamurella silvestris]
MPDLPSSPLDAEPQKVFRSAEAFRTWLQSHENLTTGVWLVLAKKGSDLATVTYAEALEVALAHGWIDGQARSLDERASLRRFTARRPRSPWSTRNREIAEAMITDGRMTPRGLAEVQKAKADGRWDRAYEGSRNATPHPDFLAALQADPAAAAFYETLNSSRRYSIYYRIHEAKREDTRARRIATMVEMLARGETLRP